MAIKRTEIHIDIAEAEENRFMKKHLCGCCIGAGIEKAIDANWRIGVELANTFYPSQKIKEEVANGSLKQILKTNSTTVALRLTYTF